MSGPTGLQPGASAGGAAIDAALYNPASHFQTVDMTVVTNVAWSVSNQALLSRLDVLVAPMVIAKLYWRCVFAGSGNYDIGLYSASGLVLTRIYNLGSTAAPEGGIITITLGTPITLQPGVVYYAAIVCSSTAQQVYSVSGGASDLGVPGYRAVTADTSFPLPASMTLGSGGVLSTGRVPWIAGGPT